MPPLYIRLDNRFVYQKGKQYFVTDITNRKEWKKMTTKEKHALQGKNVTVKVKNLLKTYGSKANMNFKSKPSKKRIRTKRKQGRSLKGRSLKGGS
jgi:hypothetical protein